MMNTLSALARYLQEHRSEITTHVEVLQEVYDPTYGLQDPRSTYIETINFDALLNAIDDFARTFR